MKRRHRVSTSKEGDCDDHRDNAPDPALGFVSPAHRLPRFRLPAWIHSPPVLKVWSSSGSTDVLMAALKSSEIRVLCGRQVLLRLRGRRGSVQAGDPILWHAMMSADQSVLNNNRSECFAPGGSHGGMRSDGRTRRNGATEHARKRSRALAERPALPAAVARCGVFSVSSPCRRASVLIRFSVRSVASPTSLAAEGRHRVCVRGAACGPVGGQAGGQNHDGRRSREGRQVEAIDAVQCETE